MDVIVAALSVDASGLIPDKPKTQVNKWTQKIFASEKCKSNCQYLSSYHYFEDFKRNIFGFKMTQDRIHSWIV